MAVSRLAVTLLAVPLAALVIACGSSGSSTSAGAAGAEEANAGAGKQSAAPTTVKAGETLTLTESFLGSKTKVEITLSNVRYGVKPSNQFDKAEKGQFVVAEVAVKVVEGKFSISSGSFKLVAADGTAYNTSFMTGVNNLSANDLAPGQKSAGSVVFDAAKGAEKGGRIALTNLLADGDAGYWSL